MDTFVEANDFKGKTVIPFATSSSSGMGEWTGIVIVRNRIFENVGRVQGILLVFSVIKTV